MRILFSVAYAGTFSPPPGHYLGAEVSVAARRSDWGLRGVRKQLFHLFEAVGVAWRGRKFDVLVLCTVGIEAFLIARLRRLLCRKTKVVCFDLLIPRPGRLATIVGPWLTRLDAVLCIRRGDLKTVQRRFRVSGENCYFVPFPANTESELPPVTDRGYVYAAGWAHRDWATLVAALARTPFEAQLSVGGPIEVPPEIADRMRVLPQQSPEAGRQLMAAARLVVLPMKDTELPSGPLILLDAMTMRKPIIVTRVNGTRDYVVDDVTAVVVPPGDVEALAAAISRVMGDAGLRQRLAESAGEVVRQRFSMRHCLEGILRVLTDKVIGPHFETSAIPGEM